MSVPDGDSDSDEDVDGDEQTRRPQLLNLNACKFTCCGISDNESRDVKLGQSRSSSEVRDGNCRTVDARDEISLHL